MDKRNNQTNSTSQFHPETKVEDRQAWSQWYMLTEHWQSDMKFFHDELDFLNILVDKYFIRLAGEKATHTRIKPVAMTLWRIEARERELAQNITKHLQYIQESMENPYARDPHAFKDEHADLEIEVANFFKDLRSIKSEIFSLTEQVLRSEKAKHLLAEGKK